MRFVSGISFAAVAALLVAGPVQGQRRTPAPAERPWSVEGRLEATDSRDESERRYDEHRIRLTAGQRYRITANSDDFDTVVQLLRGGEVIAENDDGGEGLNSRLFFAPDASGDYVLRVLGFSSESLGAYAARAEALPPLPPATLMPPTTETTHWTVVRGELTADDPESEGSRFDDYIVYIGEGEEVLVRLDGAFDTLLSIYRADEREGEPLAMDDDGGGGLNSMLLFRADQAGDYIVRVGAFAGEGGGPYRLRVGR